MGLVAAFIQGNASFLPDPTLYPVGSIPEPPSLVSPVIAGCPPGPYTVRFNAPQDGDYYILLDLNGIPGFQDNSRDRFFELIDQKEGLLPAGADAHSEASGTYELGVIELTLARIGL